MRKLGHDFGRTPFGHHQVLAHRDARDELRDKPIWRTALERGIGLRRRGFGNETAAACGEHDAKARERARRRIA